MKTRIPSVNYRFDLFGGCVFVLWNHARSDVIRLVFEMDDMKWTFNFTISIDKDDQIHDEHILCIGLFYDRTRSMAALDALRNHITQILQNVFSESVEVDWEVERYGTTGVAKVSCVPCDLPTIMLRVDQVIEQLR